MSESNKKRPTLIVVAIVLLSISLAFMAMGLISNLISLFDTSSIDDTIVTLQEVFADAELPEGFFDAIITFYRIMIVLIIVMEVIFICLTVAMLLLTINARSKKQIKGWAIAYLVLAVVLGGGIISYIAPILIFCTKPSDFEIQPEYTTLPPSDSDAQF